MSIDMSIDIDVDVDVDVDIDIGVYKGKSVQFPFYPSLLSTSFLWPHMHITTIIRLLCILLILKLLVRSVACLR